MQDRIADQSIVNIVGILANLFLKGGQVGQLTERRDHRKDGVQFSDLRNMGLDEQDGLLRTYAGSQQVESQIICVLPAD